MARGPRDGNLAVWLTRQALPTSRCRSRTASGSIAGGSIAGGSRPGSGDLYGSGSGYGSGSLYYGSSEPGAPAQVNRDILRVRAPCQQACSVPAWASSLLCGRLRRGVSTAAGTRLPASSAARLPACWRLQQRARPPCMHARRSRSSLRAPSPSAACTAWRRCCTRATSRSRPALSRWSGGRWAPGAVLGPRSADAAEAPAHAAGWWRASRALMAHRCAAAPQASASPAAKLIPLLSSPSAPLHPQGLQRQAPAQPRHRLRLAAPQRIAAHTRLHHHAAVAPGAGALLRQARRGGHAHQVGGLLAAACACFWGSRGQPGLAARSA
jgi:hypothetical protein